MAYNMFDRGHKNLEFSISFILLSLKNVFILANSADPDEILNFDSFHLGVLCM